MPKRSPHYDEKAELERRIAFSDRGAAYAAALQLLSWLVGSVFALNGGGLLFVLGSDVLDWQSAQTAALLFFVGVTFAFLLGMMGVVLSLHFANVSNVALERWRSEEAPRLTRFRLHIILMGFVAVFSFAFAVSGGMVALSGLDAAHTRSVSSGLNSPAKSLAPAPNRTSHDRQ